MIPKDGRVDPVGFLKLIHQPHLKCGIVYYGLPNADLTKYIQS